MARKAFLRNTGSRLKPQTFDLNIDEPFVVGRDPGSNLTIENDENISEKQFIVRYCKDWDCWTVEDCKSRIGTYLNEYKVFQNDRWDLNEGDKINIPIGWNQYQYVWEFGFYTTDFDIFDSIGKKVCRFGCMSKFKNHEEKYGEFPRNVINLRLYQSSILISEHEWTIHGLKRAFSCELCTKKTWNRIQMDKHKTTTHNDVPKSNESDSTCPVCRKSFKSARIRDRHFKYNKICNPMRNMQNMQKFNGGKNNIHKKKDQMENKKTHQTEILPTPQSPVKDKKITDLEDIDYVAESQKSSPSKGTPNQSDSTCPVCRKIFKSVILRDLHFKYNKKCNPMRNLQKEKFTVETEIVPTPQLPVKDKKNTDQDDIDYAAEDQKIEAFYQKSSPSKEKGIIFFQNAKLGHLNKVKFLVLFR